MRRKAVQSEISKLGFQISAARRLGTARRGATMVELLISMSIAAALLTATAVAVDASLKSFQVNQEQSTLTQRARMGMHRILSTIRAGEAHRPHDDDANQTLHNGFDVEDTGIEMLTAEGTPVVYRYDAATKRLLADVGGAGGATHVLMEGVEKFLIYFEPMKSAAHARGGLDHDLLQRATVYLTVRATGETNLPGEAKGQLTVSMSSAAMPRRNSW